MRIENKSYTCSFCGRPETKVKNMLANWEGTTFICSICIRRSVSLLKANRNKPGRILELYPNVPDSIS